MLCIICKCNVRFCNLSALASVSVTSDFVVGKLSLSTSKLKKLNRITPVTRSATLTSSGRITLFTVDFFPVNLKSFLIAVS